VDRYARQVAELETRHAPQEEEQISAAPQPEQAQWYAAPDPQPQQQPYMEQNPWAPNPWVSASYAPSPWAQQPASPQAYYAPQQAYAWPNEPGGLPDTSYVYG